MVVLEEVGSEDRLRKCPQRYQLGILFSDPRGGAVRRTSSPSTPPYSSDVSKPAPVHHPPVSCTVPTTTPSALFHETEQMGSWWAQCKRQAGDGQEPVLIHRKSRAAWRVRMFGALPLPSGQKIKCPVDISVDTFLIYLRYRLLQELPYSMSEDHE